MPGVLFDGRSDPLTRVIVHRDHRQDSAGRSWHLVAPLAYDIARRIGAKAPDTHPVRFSLNGQFQGVYVLTDHIRAPYMKARYGHTNFTRADTELKERLRAVVAEISPLSMATVDQFLDIESLTRWFVSVVFCATTDPFQGVMFQDRTQSNGRWFWINWDMDHSFMDRYGQATDLWTHDTFATTLNQPILESEVLTRLIAEDPAFRDYLAAMVTDVLNHHVTLEFFRERLDHYRAIADDYGVKNPDYLDDLVSFFVRRSSEVRRLLSQYLDLGPTHRLRVEGFTGVGVEVDGYRKTTAFSGRYFSDMEVEVALPEPRLDFSHWLVNGQPVRTPTLRHLIDSDTIVTQVLLGNN